MFCTQCTNICSGWTGFLPEEGLRIEKYSGLSVPAEQEINCLDRSCGISWAHMRRALGLHFLCLLGGAAVSFAAKVDVGPDGFLRIDGKPNFPIGMYSAGRYDEMAQAGFTATHSYAVSAGEAADATNSTDARLKTLLDKNATNGLRMMVELPR